MYKKGDKVRWIGASDSWHTHGNIYSVYGGPRENPVITNDANCVPFLVSQYEIQSVTVTPKETNMWDSYTFQIRSKEQIEDSEIQKDLSFSNPMMIAEISGSDMVRVYLHDSIWSKAYSYPIEAGYRMSRQARKLESILGWESRITKKDMGKLIKLIRKIRKAPWGKPYNATVTVKKIKV